MWSKKDMQKLITRRKEVHIQIILYSTQFVSNNKSWALAISLNFSVPSSLLNGNLACYLSGWYFLERILKLKMISRLDVSGFSIRISSANRQFRGVFLDSEGGCMLSLVSYIKYVYLELHNF